jgi:uncharacterized Tic20 family protein
MGTLFRLLFRLFGRTSTTDLYLSEVSKTIESLPCPDRTRWFWGGLLHCLPVAAGIVVLFSLRHSAVTHPLREVIALLLAAIWSWLGPVLIWYYERHTLPAFERQCRRIVAHPHDLETIHHAVYSNIFALNFARIFTPVWVLIVVFAFANVSDFVQGFGVFGWRDPFWWVLLVGVALIAYYTSVGFSLSYKAFQLTRMVAASKLDSRIFHPDGVFGLSFIGDFAFLTAAMFFSGWLFAPLLFFSAGPRSFIEYLTSTPVLLLVILFAFTIFSFLMPIYTIHSKILREKMLRSHSIYEAANDTAGAPLDAVAEDRVRRFDFAKRLIDEVQAIPNWPLRLDTALKFMLTSILVPALATAVAAVLKAKTGAG